MKIRGVTRIRTNPSNQLQVQPDDPRRRLVFSFPLQPGRDSRKVFLDGKYLDVLEEARLVGRLLGGKEQQSCQ